MVCGGTRNAANRNEPTASTAGDLAGRPHERQAVGGDRAGIGQAGRGQRVGQRQRADARGGRTGQHADADEHRPHRAAAHAGRDQPAGRRHVPSVWRQLTRARCGALRRVDLARIELLAGDLLDLVHVAEDRAQFVQERDSSLVQVGRGFQQVLVGGHLSRGGEQQRRHRLVAAHPALGDILAARLPAPAW